MVCKFPQLLEFVREYKLLDDFEDNDIQAVFESFPHCCSWDKGLGFAEVDADRLYIAIEKVLEVLNDSYEHEYSEAQLLELGSAFIKVFEMANAPVKPVPFVIVMLSRI